MEKKLLFFVDDDKSIRNLVEYTVCMREEYEIKTFSTGEECLDNVHLNPDLFVLDHMLIHSDSKYNGLTLLKELRGRGIKTPIFILSSETDENLIADYYKNGVTHFIPKNGYFIDKVLEYLENQLLK